MSCESGRTPERASRATASPSRTYLYGSSRVRAVRSALPDRRIRALSTTDASSEKPGARSASSGPLTTTSDATSTATGALTVQTDALVRCERFHDRRNRSAASARPTRCVIALGAVLGASRSADLSNRCDARARPVRRSSQPVSRARASGRLIARSGSIAVHVRSGDRRIRSGERCARSDDRAA